MAFAWCRLKTPTIHQGCCVRRRLPLTRWVALATVALANIFTGTSPPAGITPTLCAGCQKQVVRKHDITVLNER